MKEENFWVERMNTFNELRPKGMTLNQVRFFAIYQAKINAREPEKREVVFPLNDFVKIMDLQKLNITKLKNTIDNLIRQIVHLPNKQKNGFIVIPLFSRCEVYQNELSGEWFVKIECHPEAMPYMFEMKKNYFKYQLWNALRLSSVNQIRMYEILKQYEKIGTRTVQLDILKEMLGIEKKQYTRYQDFRIRVLEPCQKAIVENTDIKFEYSPIKKSRKIIAIKFDIFKNKDYNDVLQLNEFIDKADIEQAVKQPEKSEPKDLKDLYRKYFSDEQDELVRKNIKSLLRNIYSTKTMIDKRTQAIYDKSIATFKLKMQSDNIRNPIAYIQGIINNIIDDEMRNPHREKKTSYDLSEIEKCAINAAEIEEIEKFERGEITEIEKPIKKQDVQVFTETVEENGTTISDKNETADGEPVRTSDDVLNPPYNEYFETVKEETDLCIRMLEFIKVISDYEESIHFLDIFDLRWRNFEWYCKELIYDELSKKQNAPNVIESSDL